MALSHISVVYPVKVLMKKNTQCDTTSQSVDRKMSTAITRHCNSKQLATIFTKKKKKDTGRRFNSKLMQWQTAWLAVCLPRTQRHIVTHNLFAHNLQLHRCYALRHAESAIHFSSPLIVPVLIICYYTDVSIFHPMTNEATLWANLSFCRAVCLCDGTTFLSLGYRDEETLEVTEKETDADAQRE